MVAMIDLDAHQAAMGFESFLRGDQAVWVFDMYNFSVYQRAEAEVDRIPHLWYLLKWVTGVVYLNALRMNYRFSAS